MRYSDAMKRWVIEVNGQVVWEGTDKRTPEDRQLDEFMAQLYGNEIPVAFPMVIEYNPKDWRTRVHASLLYARDLYGDPIISTEGFDLDEIIPSFTAPEDARF